MNDASHNLAVYLHLAQASLRRQRPLVRDRMLLLAGMQAAKLNLFRLGQYCRGQILQHNPHHFVGRWPSIAAGMQTAEFQSLASSIQQRYPLEHAEQMLVQLGIEISHEAETYYDEAEYAAAILNIDKHLVDDNQQDE